MFNNMIIDYDHFNYFNDCFDYYKDAWSTSPLFSSVYIVGKENTGFSMCSCTAPTASLRVPIEGVV